MVNNEEDLSKWKDVFVLPRSGITQNLTERALVLHQVHIGTQFNHWINT